MVEIIIVVGVVGASLATGYLFGRFYSSSKFKTDLKDRDIQIAVLQERLACETRRIHFEEAQISSSTQITEVLKRFDEKIDSVEHTRVRSQQDLNRFIHTLQNATDRLGQETGKLNSALRSTRGQGRWGEAQLRNVIRSVGLHEFCDFKEQASTTTGSRPDLIISLPGGKKLVVDAKVSLNAFLESSESGDPSKKSQFLKDHVAALKNHAKVLADKNYPGSLVDALPMTLLFLPCEALYSAALEIDEALPTYCYERKVLIVTPISLVAFLTLVSSGWQEVKLNEGAREISALGKELYKRLHIFNDHLSKLGRSLNSAVKDFNSTAASMESRVLVNARRLAELGASTEQSELFSVERIETAVRTTELDSINCV